ncbi:hypothetical protein HDU92_005125 [Lobulomyces angularis]|nr:hypothetical protein HDU92_005125 [Lobulomyces angularis]
MVSFVCDYCQETLKKAKLDNHTYRCKNYAFSCIDCYQSFQGTSYKGHTSCITEDQKVQGSLYKPPKGKKIQQPKQQQKAVVVKKKVEVEGINGEVNESFEPKSQSTLIKQIEDKFGKPNGLHSEENEKQEEVEEKELVEKEDEEKNKKIKKRKRSTSDDEVEIQKVEKNKKASDEEAEVKKEEKNIKTKSSDKKEKKSKKKKMIDRNNNAKEGILETVKKILKKEEGDLSIGLLRKRVVESLSNNEENSIQNKKDIKKLFDEMVTISMKEDKLVVF